MFFLGSLDLRSMKRDWNLFRKSAKQNRVLVVPPLSTNCDRQSLITTSAPPPPPTKLTSNLLNQNKNLKAELKRAKLEINELKMQINQNVNWFSCQICLDSKGTDNLILIQPCNHTACNQCCSKIERCHMCNSSILNKLKIYV